MGKFVTPQVFLVAETAIVPEGLHEALCALGVSGWDTDAYSDSEKLMEFAGKSCYLSFSTDLNKNLTKVGTRNNFEYLQEGIIGTKHGCYDAETEVLTALGWKRWPDVTEQDALATRSPSGALEYHRPKALIEAPYSGRMFRVEARGVDLFVTDNHNMLVCKTTTKEGRKKQSFELMEARDLGHSSHAYIKNAVWAADPGGTRKEALALLGFAIGDGTYANGSVAFHLRKERKITYLTRLCRSLDWELAVSGDRYRVYVPDAYRSVFAGIYDDGREKTIPAGMMLTHSAEELEYLYEGLIASDGHESATGVSFDTTSRNLADQMQQLCLHIGLAANVCYEYDKDRRPSSYGDKTLIRLSIIRRELTPEVNKYIGGVGRSFWVDDWEGMVYCAEVPHNTLYVRRGGKPVWCGNSVLEHASASVYMFNVSRVLTHELVRHRPGTAYSQVSGRYVRTDEIDMFLPSLIAGNPRAVDLFERAQDQMEDWVTELEDIFGIAGMKDFSLKKKLTSAFRRVVGNGQANHILATGNHRAWRHMIQNRTSRHAEEEIRLAYAKVFEIFVERYPAVYADYDMRMVEDIPEITFQADKV